MCQPQADVTWFLKIDPVLIVGMCVCPSLLIASGIMWCDMDLIRLVKQLTAVIIVKGRGLGIGTRCRH